MAREGSRSSRDQRRARASGLPLSVPARPAIRQAFSLVGKNAYKSRVSWKEHARHWIETRPQPTEWTLALDDRKAVSEDALHVHGGGVVPSSRHCTTTSAVFASTSMTYATRAEAGQPSSRAISSAARVTAASEFGTVRVASRGGGAPTPALHTRPTKPSPAITACHTPSRPSVLASFRTDVPTIRFHTPHGPS